METAQFGEADQFGEARRLGVDIRVQINGRVRPETAVLETGALELFLTPDEPSRAVVDRLNDDVVDAVAARSAELFGEARAREEVLEHYKGISRENTKFKLLPNTQLLMGDDREWSGRAVYVAARVTEIWRCEGIEPVLVADAIFFSTIA
jgi:hypothetical protein